jgi:pimeloyl-ACP methyl ester carboxylesterase
MLPLLTANEAGYPSFHVVAPSLPGYAWSEPASKRGFHPGHYAEVRTQLMPEQPVLTNIKAL